MNIISGAKRDFFPFSSCTLSHKTWHRTNKDKVNYPEDQLFLSGYGHTQLFNAIKCLPMFDIQDHRFVLLCLPFLIVHSVHTPLLGCVVWALELFLLVYLFLSKEILMEVERNSVWSLSLVNKVKLCSLSIPSHVQEKLKKKHFF